MQPLHRRQARAGACKLERRLHAACWAPRPQPADVAAAVEATPAAHAAAAVLRRASCSGSRVDMRTDMPRHHCPPAAQPSCAAHLCSPATACSCAAQRQHAVAMLRSSVAAALLPRPSPGTRPHRPLAPSSAARRSWRWRWRWRWPPGARVVGPTAQTPVPSATHFFSAARLDQHSPVCCSGRWHGVCVSSPVYDLPLLSCSAGACCVQPLLCAATLACTAMGRGHSPLHT